MPEGIFTQYIETGTPVPMTSQLQRQELLRLRRQYPFVYQKTLSVTAHGRKIPALQLGCGSNKVLLTAGHHANEYITTMLVWQLLRRYCRAVCDSRLFAGFDARELYHNAMLYVVPMVNPDGIDLVTGAIRPGSAEYERAAAIAARYPRVPFPQGWKANLEGVDLNLNYPARWDTARQIKRSLGVSGPAPRDYPGAHPLDQPETAALAAYTCCIRPDLVLAYHTQGGEIYHAFAGIRLPQADALAQAFARASGYRVAEVPPESANAGFKDWFLQRFHRPGFTIEAGRGENPLPLTQLDTLVCENEAILALALSQ